MHKSVFTWDVFTWICIYMDLRSQRLWENFCASLSFAAHALVNSEHFISYVFKSERADLAVFCCAKGTDNDFGISAFPREKISTTRTSDKWDSARVPPAPGGSSPTAECVVPQHSRAELHRSCQGVDGCGHPAGSTDMESTRAKLAVQGVRCSPAGPKESCCTQGAHPGLAARAGELGVIVPGC